MSLHSDPIGPVPEETAPIARAAFRKGNLCIRLRDVLGTIYVDEEFADLFSSTGRPAEAPWRLALVSRQEGAQWVFQEAQHLAEMEVTLA